MRLRTYMLCFFLVALSACATTPPFAPEALHAINQTITPDLAVQDSARGAQVLWGGVIIGSVNLPDHTDFNVLFYPLNKTQRPDLEQTPQSRFIVRYAGYLETMVYAPGREITVLGSLQAAEEGKVGDAPYLFPVVKADKIFLWPVGGDSKVRFGIGVGIGVHM